MEISLILTFIFIGIIIIVPFFLRNSKPVNSIANIVTTLGVLGTFIGIFWGLINFNVSNIQESIPQLLDGLRFAFLTSIMGIAYSVILKSYPKKLISKFESEIVDEATIETLAELLEKLIKQNQDFQDENNNQLINIEKALAGEGDTTLLTQIQKLRTTFTDKHDELLKEFKDFSSKINEQFGENFKKLNDAVGKLLEWQNNYKEQIELMINQYKNALEGLETSTKLLSELIEKANKFENIANNLNDILVGIRSEIDYFEEFSKDFSEISENAKDAFPVIKENLENLTENMKKLISDQSQSVMELQNNFNNNTNEMTSRLSSSINNMMNDNAQQINNQIAVIDNALKEELNNSLRTLGEQLAALSTKFVNDYGPLTERLKEIVEMSKEV